MEDFVPFELAKKLNEKGFTLPKSNVIGKFDSDGVFHSQLYINFTETMDSEEIISPTISQVLKWLRKEKKIYIMIDRSFSVKNSWHYVICNNDDFEHLIQQESIPNRKWEQAAIAGIEYIIDNNLI